MYELHIITSGGSINNTFCFNTLEEVKEEMEFYKISILIENLNIK